MNGPGAGAVQQVPPQQQQVVVQQEEQPKKESKYGGLKQTVRTVPFLLFRALCFVFPFCVLCFVFRVYFYFGREERCADVFCCWIGQLATSAVGGVGFGAGAFSVLVFGTACDVFVRS